MDYKEKYDKLVEAVKVLQEANPSDEGIQNWVNDNVPELRESEDEKVREDIIHLVNAHGQGRFRESMLAWLEKQKDINSKEYVFRPHAGCDINTAAIQAVEQQKLGKKIVLAFNGAYIPVEEKTANDIVNKYYSWLEKQGTSYTKKDVDDAYVEGMAFAKDELEKQKPAWSEADNLMLAKVINFIPHHMTAQSYNEFFNWLKSLRNRIKGE